MVDPLPEATPVPPLSHHADWVETTVRVRYAETDAQGVVYHANYLVYMEVGRAELARSGGVPYSELEARGVNLVVAGADLRFKAPARYDDLLRIRLRVRRLGGRTVTFEYRIERQEDGRLLVTGETTHVCLGSDFRPATIPDWVVEVLTGGPGSTTADLGGSIG